MHRFLGIKKRTTGCEKKRNTVFLWKRDADIRIKDKKKEQKRKKKAERTEKIEKTTEGLGSCIPKW